MTDHSDLVARLRAQGETVHSGAYHVMREAAALIETQAAELEALLEVVRALAKFDGRNSVVHLREWANEVLASLETKPHD